MIRDESNGRHAAKWVPFGSGDGTEPRDWAGKDFRLQANSPVFPRPLNFSINGNSAPGEVFSDEENGDLFPMIWNNREPQGTASVVSGGIMLEMDYDGRHPRALALPMIWSRYYNALSPARPRYGRDVIYVDGVANYGPVQELGYQIGAIRPDPDDSRMQDFPVESSGGLWRVAGPGEKIGTNRWRIMAFPIIKPLWTVWPAFRWVKVGNACYVWEPPEEPSTIPTIDSGDDVSFFPTDPVIYDLWELRAAPWEAAVGPTRYDWTSVIDGIWAKIYPDHNWLWGSGAANNFRMLVARDFDLGSVSHSELWFPVVPHLLANTASGLMLVGGARVMERVVEYLSERVKLATSITYNWRVESNTDVEVLWQMSGRAAPSGDYVEAVQFREQFGLFGQRLDGWWQPSSAGDQNNALVSETWGYFTAYRVKWRQGVWDFYGPGHPPPFLDPRVFGTCGLSGDREAVVTVSEVAVDDGDDDVTDEDETVQTVICTGSVTWVWVSTSSTEDSGGPSGGEWVQDTDCVEGCTAVPPEGVGDFPGDEVQTDCVSQ